MGIDKGEKFKNDVFVDYPYEQVKFRWDCRESKIFKRFYGMQEIKEPVPHDNRLYNEALMWGQEIDQQSYNSD